MTKQILLAAFCVAVVACGGDDKKSNAAVSARFTYGEATPASSYDVSAIQGSVSRALALQSSPSLSGTVGATEFGDVTSELLGSPSAPYAIPGTAAGDQSALAQRALTIARSAALSSPIDYGTNFDDPQCVSVTPTSVTLSNCTIALNDSYGDYSQAGKVTADGWVAIDGAKQTESWDLTISVHITMSGGGQSVSVGSTFHAAGSLTVTAPTATADGTITGDITNETSMYASGGGNSASAEMDEALILNLTYETSPSTCVTGGTIEAKRVWPVWSVPGSTRPSNLGALVTFTGCGSATIQISQ